MKRIIKGDLILIVVLIVLGGLGILLSNRLLSTTDLGNKVQIEIDGEIYEAYSLGENFRNIRVESPRGYNVLRIDDSKVRVIEADCPDQICVHFGWIQRAGQTIVCLPNRLIVRVVSGENSDEGLELDGITY